MAENTIHWEHDADGIVTLTLDDPTGSANLINEHYRESIRNTVDRLSAEKDLLTGVVITSAKKTFFAGADLSMMITIGPDEVEKAFNLGEEAKRDLRILETLGVPVVAAINGAALGAGLELALACHRRIIANVGGAVVGFPEVTMGILAGAGGVTRSVRMFGVQKSVTEILGQGTRFKPRDALKIGLVDEVVDSVDDLLPAAKAWIKANPDAHTQPWDSEGYRMPGGRPSSPKLAAMLPAFSAQLRKMLKGAPMPAPSATLAAAMEGAQVDFETACRIESRYFAQLLTSQVAKNMMQAFFFDMQYINSGGSRPAGFEPSTIGTVGVLGAGTMGAGIAYVTAKAGFEVVLKDANLEAAQKGKDHIATLEAESLERGRTTEAQSAALLERITPTGEVSDLKDVDFVVEAVFENQELKREVFQEIEDIVDGAALLGTNTSSMPITGLAAGVKRQDDFIGIHFFSPVDKMPLVEIVKGEKTSDHAVARAFDYVRAIRKTPIVVNDGRGFFTSRVIATFVNECLAMLAEGVAPSSIEQAGSQAGYPVPPLQLSDELSMELMSKINDVARREVEAAGGTYDPHPGEIVMTRMIELGRPSRAKGAGFYDYDGGRRGRLWSGLNETFGSGAAAPPMRDLIDRMLFAEALETQRCMDEGVIESTADANIGSIMGIGYPAWTGGSAQFIRGYHGAAGVGRAAFVARANELATTYGDRFLPPASLG